MPWRNSFRHHQPLSRPSLRNTCGSSFCSSRLRTFQDFPPHLCPGQCAFSGLHTGSSVLLISRCDHFPRLHPLSPNHEDLKLGIILVAKNKTCLHATPWLGYTISGINRSSRLETNWIFRKMVVFNVSYVQVPKPLSNVKNNIYTLVIDTCSYNFV